MTGVQGMAQGVIGPDFEMPIVELENKIEELRVLSRSQQMDFSDEITNLEKKCEILKQSIFGNLTAWQQVQLARHPKRPYAMDYINEIFGDFHELHGDRVFGDDAALVGGLARLGGKAVMVIGNQKGRDTKENMMRNFGMAHPEGYRKAMRLMKLAEKFGLTVISFIDTPGASPGIQDEERGQAEAISRNLVIMAGLRVPIIACITGEGGSGGALGIGAGNKVYMLEHAVYSVISPEGCASILWHDANRAAESAEALKLTAEHCLKFGIIDGIIPEPLGAAHRHMAQTAGNIKAAIEKDIEYFSSMSGDEIVEHRYAKYRAIGRFVEKKTVKKKKKV